MNQPQNTFRWIVLLPALCVVWLLSSFVGAFVFGLFDIAVAQPDISVWLIVLVLPAIAMFFTARFIAPKYKNIAGLCGIFLCCVIAWLFVNALAHSY